MYDESVNELCEASLKFIIWSGNKSNQKLLKLFAATSYRPYIKRSCVSQTNVTLRLMINTLTWQAKRKVLILLNVQETQQIHVEYEWITQYFHLHFKWHMDNTTDEKNSFLVRVLNKKLQKCAH